ncbi:MAG: fibronectin type III-like domain-contianing protein [Deinococcales bacterium]
MRYGEGLFIGYRYYDAKGIDTAFPFGHGLSYTSFSYSNLKVSQQSFKYNEGLQVSVDISNTGEVAGKEIVQLYVRDTAASLLRPDKELKAFGKVALEPGESKTLSFQLDERSFAFYHPGHKGWIVEKGSFDILVGASAIDIRLQERVEVIEGPVLASLLNHESTVREWLNDPKGKAIFEPMFQQIVKGFSASLGGDQDANIGMDMTDFMLDLPLLSLFNFQDHVMSVTPEAQLESLLAQVHSH